MKKILALLILSMKMYAPVEMDIGNGGYCPQTTVSKKCYDELREERDDLKLTNRDYNRIVSNYERALQFILFFSVLKFAYDCSTESPVSDATWNILEYLPYALSMIVLFKNMN